MNSAKVDITDEKWLRESGALPPGYTPKTDVGRRLVKLRAEFLAKGGKLLSDEELEKEIARLRE